MNQFKEYKSIKIFFKKDNEYSISKYVNNEAYKEVIKSYKNNNYNSLINHKNKVIKIFFLGIVPLGIIGFILYMIGIPWIIIWSHKNNLSEGLIPGIATAFYISFIILTFLFFAMDYKYVTKKFNDYFSTFKKLIELNYINLNIENYPDGIQMCYYANNRNDWRSSHPNSYKNFNFYIATQSLCIFFDKLKDN